MAEGYVYSRAEADETAVRDAIWCLRSELAYVIQTRTEDIAFDELPEDGPKVLWPEGRAFGPGAEIRWQQAGPGRYNLMVLSESQRDLGDDWVGQAYQVRDQWPDDKLLRDANGCPGGGDGGGVRDQRPDTKPLRVYLWGTWQPVMRAWVEVRIPHPLPYPVKPLDTSKRHRIYVTAAEYTQGGMVRFIRWKMLHTKEV